MNCSDCKELLIGYIEGFLNESQKQDVSQHLSNCQTCRAELQTLKNLNERLVKNGKAFAQSNLEDKVFSTILRQQRDKLKAANKAGSALKIRNIIMKNPLIKIAAAAVIIIAVSLFGLFLKDQKVANDFSFFAKACAAENALFIGEDIVHIKNEIIVFTPTESSEQLDYVWLPICSLKADGQFMFNQLKLNVYEEPYLISDEAWYEPATGKFIRIFKSDEKIIFANSYDGEFIYTTQIEPDGSLQLISQAITEDFIPPLEPAEFLGMGAGLQSSLQESNSKVHSLTEEFLEDGSPVKVFKVGMADPDGQLLAYWLFRVRNDNETIAEQEFFISDEPRLLVRRVLAESVLTARYSWNLGEIQGQSVTSDTGPQVTLTLDMVKTDISVQNMVDSADFETYFFAVNPSWTGQIQIISVLDPTPFGESMFCFAARADDGRHLVMVQSAAYNVLGPVVQQQGTLVYTSDNGFKVWGGGRSDWLAEILLSSAIYVIKDPPSGERVGYILESPAGTFPALAINGPLSDQELQELIDSIIPAKDYLEIYPYKVSRQKTGAENDEFE